MRYPDGREMTVAMKHLAPKGHMEVVDTQPAPECIPEKAENLEVVETQPAPERIPEKAENLPLNTRVSVTPYAEPSSVPEPQPELTPVLNSEPVHCSQQVTKRNILQANV